MQNLKRLKTTIRQTLLSKFKGFYIGGCVDGKPLNFRAHAHVNEDKKEFGWICIRDNKDVCSEVIIHELSHFLSSHMHDDRFYGKELELIIKFKNRIREMLGEMNKNI